jgi:hypothetical protein
MRRCDSSIASRRPVIMFSSAPAAAVASADDAVQRWFLVFWSRPDCHSYGGSNRCGLIRFRRWMLCTIHYNVRPYSTITCRGRGSIRGIKVRSFKYLCIPDLSFLVLDWTPEPISFDAALAQRSASHLFTCTESYELKVVCLQRISIMLIFNKLS